MIRHFSREEVYENAVKYFNGDTLAANVWTDKYALKDGNGRYYELTPDDMHRRLANEFFRIESEYPNPISKEVIYSLLKNFKYVIPQGSPMAGIGNNFVTTSLSNCFVLPSPLDSYSGIMRTDEEQVQIMKRRGGVGHDLSTLRAKGMLANGAILEGETGATLYMHRYSNSTREVAQDKRRGALMLSMSVKHPDADRFINMKTDNTKVTGANISIKLDDEFMHAVINDENYVHQFPIDAVEPEFIKINSAKKLWDNIVHNAWAHAEPGVLFWDNVLKESPARGYGDDWKEKSTNPCQPGWATVLTPQGIRTLNDIKIGDYIWSSEGWTNVVNKVNSGIKDVYAYKTTGGIFVGTDNHRILSSGVKIEVGKSKSIDLLAGYNPNTIKNANPLACVDGLVIGDGSVHKASNDLVILYIGKNDKDYLNSYISPLIGRSREELAPGAYEVKSSIKPYELPKTYCRRIPKRYLTSDHDTVCEFLKGLYSANGSVVGKRVTLKTASSQLRDDVQIMLSSVGIRSYYTTNKPKEVQFSNGKYSCKESYDINISTDREIFLHKIGFLQEYKNSKLLNSLGSTSNKLKTHKIIAKEFISTEEVFDITVDNKSHTYWSGGLNVSNCSELPLPPYDSCRLLAINLYSYVDKPFTPDATFNFNKFIKHVELAQRLMDDLVSLEIEKITKIITKIESDPEPDDIKYVELNLWKNILQKAILGRRTGLGITAEGDMLAALGLRYGTDQAIEFATLVHKTMAMASYRSSINLAKERGAFPIWNYEKDLKSDFINRMISVFNDEDPAVIDDWKKYGRRNIANLTIAPTGSISLLTRTTSGIEPLFLPFYKRRRKTEDPSKSVFKDEVGDMWEEYLVIHPKFEDWYKINYKDGKPMSEMSLDELTELFKISPYYKSTSEDVDYYGKIKMQGSIQKYVDHSISMTTNIPESSSKSLVADLYMLAWKYGCKGATVYRSGSRSGVLVSVNNKSTDEFDYVNAAKRPKELPCNVHTMIANGKKHNVFVGLLNDKPYEIFITDYLTNEKNLVIKKLGRGKYNLLKDGKLYIANLTSDMSDEQEAITRLISTSLRHRADIKFIVEQLLKTRGNILSFCKVLARTLKRYIPDGASSTIKCSECGSSNVVFEEGCNKCNDCGGSKCG